MTTLIFAVRAGGTMEPDTNRPGTLYYKPSIADVQMSQDFANGLFKQLGLPRLSEGALEPEQLGFFDKRILQLLQDHDGLYEAPRTADSQQRSWQKQDQAAYLRRILADLRRLTGEAQTHNLPIHWYVH